MSYNGSGTFLINSAGQPVVANTVISATVFNALTSDLATGLSTAITKDGQTTITNNIPFGSNKITGLGSGTAAADAANLGQVQSTVAKLITVTGTDTITGSMSPQLTAYAAGQLFYFVANAANTSAVTLNIDSLGAKNITRDGSSALAAGDINSGEVVVVIYDGTRFQMINAANSFGNTTINGTLTVTGNAGFQANVSITSALSVGGVFAVTGAATFTANPTLSGGTANGVLYLNGSKVATSGSALVFDGTNLGIGTTSPSGKLDVSASSGVATLIRNSDATNGFGLKITAGGSASSRYAFHVLDSTDTTSYLIVSTATGSVGNVGIGTTSPSAKIHAVSAVGADAGSFSDGSTYTLAIRRAGSTGNVGLLTGTAGSALAFGTNNVEVARFDTSGNLGLGVTAPDANFDIAKTGLDTGITNVLTNVSFSKADRTTGITIGYRTDETTAVIAPRTATGNLAFYTYNGGWGERLRLNNAGNLGLGVTPSAWGSGRKAIQLGGSVNYTIGNDNYVIGTNWYHDGNNSLYLTSAFASQYLQNSSNGEHRWYTAPSGTAGNTITFTQAMTLDASGRLGIGTTSPGARLDAYTLNNSSSAYQLSLRNGTGNNNVSAGLVFGFNSTAADPDYLAGIYGLITNRTTRAADLLFSTAATGTLTERARFNSTGAFVFAGGTTTADGIGITFPATQSASSNANTLDDYEEGTWTGTLKGSTTDPTTPVTATGKYTKIGRQVTVAIYFENVNTTGATGGVYVTGLPFTEDGTRAVCTCASYNFDFPAGVTSLFGDFSGTAIYGVISGDNVAWADLQHSAGAGRYLRMTGTYFV